MAQFINAKENLVVDAIDGGLRASGSRSLARLDGYPHIKVVCRTDHKGSRVAVISGGGSGHEPGFAGYVGKGMLTAAVCGEIFAAPSMNAVLAGILAVTGKAGCLLIVTNYTGDRLSFGLAAEKARALGKKVDIVFVSDDIAIPGIAQPRGVAGTVLVQKIAGYFAEQGAPLAEVTAAARNAAKSTVSLGISLSSCTLPGIGREDRVPKGKAELGLGVHGEPGVELINFTGARQAAALLCAKLFAAVAKAKSYALMVNNLGSTTPLEMGLIANEILNSAYARKIKLVIGPAPIMTSLDMHGISASLLPLTPKFEKALTAKVAPAAWPGACPNGEPTILKLSPEMKSRPAKPSANAELRDLVERACDALLVQEGRLNALDAKVGDGDTGSTIATAARNLKANIDKMPLANASEFFDSLSELLAKTIGGSSGGLLAILFAAAGLASTRNSAWATSLQTGLRRMMEYGGAKAGDRTMIDALEPALEVLAAGKPLSEAAVAARRGADATAKMTRAKAGRSAYVSPANLAGINDPGAEAVACLLEGLVNQK